MRPEYRLQVEDVLRIQVYGQPQLVGDAPIGPDGRITPPSLPPILAEGRTVSELIKELADQYDKVVRVRSPLVSVTIIRFRELRASVGGAVARPGSFVVRPGDTVQSLLMQGGGPVKDLADLKRATLKRKGSRELIPIDLNALLNNGDLSQNYEVFDGDELNVPEGKNLVIKIQGKLQAPGLYPFRENMTLSDAISLARGEVVGRSRLSQVLVIRERPGAPGDYIYIRADYVRYIRSRDVTQNVVLQPGDLIWVPETNTPDFGYINALANVGFILDRFGGGLFGLRIFGN